MEQVEWRHVALREQPYGLDLLPDKERVEYGDPRNEAATEARWAPVLERLGIPILGMRDVPSEAVRLEIDGFEWELVPMGTGVYDVPVSSRGSTELRKTLIVEPLAVWNRPTSRSITPGPTAG